MLLSNTPPRQERRKNTSQEGCQAGRHTPSIVTPSMSTEVFKMLCLEGLGVSNRVKNVPFIDGQCVVKVWRLLTSNY